MPQGRGRATASRSGRGPTAPPRSGSRSRPRPRTAATPARIERAEPAVEVRPSRWSRSVGLTRRAIITVVLVAVLLLSYASSLRVFVGQQRETAEARAEIVQRQQKIDQLRSEIERWQDPEYVKAQARERLGWVMPGETGYIVLGRDGKPVEGATIDTDSTRPDSDAWWAKLGGSIDSADHPAPAPQTQVGEQPR